MGASSTRLRSNTCERWNDCSYSRRLLCLLVFDRWLDRLAVIRFVMSRSLLLAVAVLLCVAVASAAPHHQHHSHATPKPPPTPPPAPTGYIVTAQWDGRTYPNVQWALNVTRQTTTFEWTQQLELQNLLPTTQGPARSPTFTAYDPISRQYFVATQFNMSAAFLWSMTLDSAVTAAPMGEPQFTNYPQYGETLVGLQAVNIEGFVALYSFFADGSVFEINTQTGIGSMFVNLCGGVATRSLTTAFDHNSKSNLVYGITASTVGEPAYEIVTLDLNSGYQWTYALTTNLTGFVAAQESAFEMLWLDNIQQLLVFFTGNFDQLLFVDPYSGNASFAIQNLAEYGLNGRYEFTVSSFLEDGDIWSNAALDSVEKNVYFQCSDVDPDSGAVTTTLCQIPQPQKIAPLYFVNAAISPMTYGYLGMQYVQVIKSQEEAAKEE